MCLVSQDVDEIRQNLSWALKLYKPKECWLQCPIEFHMEFLDHMPKCVSTLILEWPEPGSIFANSVNAGDGAWKHTGDIQQLNIIGARLMTDDVVLLKRLLPNAQISFDKCVRGDRGNQFQ